MFPPIAIGVAFILHAFLASWSSVKVHATLTNITIDDTNSTFWTWAGTWNAVTPSTPCPACTAQPDPGLAYNSTWHDGSLRSGAFTFQGAAVYIYGIDVLNPGNISFAISNPSTTGFHYYGGSGFVYNSLFFSASNLDSTVQHTVTWIIESSSVGGVTLSQPDPTSSIPSSNTNTAGSQTLSGSSPSTTPSGSATPSPAAVTAHKSKAGAIAGAVVGVVGGLAILGALFIFLRRRRSPAGQPIPSDAIPEPYQTRPAGRAAPTNYSIEPYQPPEHPSAPHTPALAQPRPFFSSEASLEAPTMSAVPSAPVSIDAMSSAPVSTAAMSSEPVSGAAMPSAPIPTASASFDSKHGPVVMAWDPHHPDGGRTRDLEERLRHLEDLADASPPAYS
ncbi:hypothetical protein B0H11DRAFT_1994280 [Mycena galericulata]|nr:hypothetical protein B0H11DRAFT_1994280 [Mycena galericulata]